MKQSCCYLLSLLLMFQPAFTYAQSGGQSPPVPVNQNTVTPTPASRALTVESEGQFHKMFAEAMADLPADIQQKISTDLVKIYIEMSELRIQLEQTYSKDGLISILDQKGRNEKGEVVVKPIIKEGVGRAEFYVIENEVYVRVIHELSEAAIFIIDNPALKFDPQKIEDVFYKTPRALLPTLYDPAKEANQPNSSHLQTIIARQHMIANSPSPGIHKGREVVIMRINPLENSVESHFLPKPARGTKQHLIEYFRMMYAKNNKYDLALAFLLGTFQAGAMVGFSHLPELLSNLNLISPEIFAGRRIINPEAIGLTFGFAVGSTMIKPTFDNWRNLGSPNISLFESKNITGDAKDLPSYQSTPLESLYRSATSQPVRRSLLSLTYRTSLVFLTAGALMFDVSFESPMSLTSIATNVASHLFSAASMGANIIIGTYSSYWWEQPAHIRAKLRLNKRPLMKGPPDETFQQAKSRFQLELFEKQIRYNLAWLVTMVDVLNLTTVNVPVLGVVSLWKIAMLAFAAVGHWRTVVAAEKHNDPDANAAQLRKDFENTWYMRVLRKIFYETYLGQYIKAYHNEFIQPKIDSAIRPVSKAAHGTRLMCNRVLGTDF